MNTLQYSKITIDELNLSRRSYNAVRRVGIDTFERLMDAYERGELLSIRNLGMKSYEEICMAISDALSGELRHENDTVKNEEMREEEEAEEYVIPKEIEEISVHKLKVSTRLHNGLVRSGFDTVGKVLRMTKAEMTSIYGMGGKSIDELKDVIKAIQEEGTGYFSKNRTENDQNDEWNKRTIDIETVCKLKEEYGFKSVWLTEWYHVTRSRIQQILCKRKNRGNWLNRILLESEQKLLFDMIEKKLEIIEADDGTKAYFLNNRKDDCAVIFVTEEEIKCFFMDSLPEELQRAIKERRLDCLSVEELDVIPSGKTISILKQTCFCPRNKWKFRQFASDRAMSIEEYCVFLTGMKYATTQSTIDDEKIMEFLNSHFINGQLMIPATPSTQWFRSFIFRNGYTIDEIAALYGFDKGKRFEDNTQQIDGIESDMEKHVISSEDWLDKLFAENPLIGNKILSEKTQEKLYVVTKGYIDKRLREPQLKLPLKAKMQIALAIVTYAKEWDAGDESGFWRYITSQFGYRDETNQLRGILCNCIFDAISKNNRWFVSGATGYKYKSTIVVHALATRRSWLLLYDFLFDFYKTNMKWNFTAEDPIVERMVMALRSKLAVGDETDDDKFEISTKVYSFQEGIRKLILYRTGYAVNLITHMLGRIDGVINHSEAVAKLYVDVLCDQWIEGKLKKAREVRSRETSSNAARSVAIDYSRIRPVYTLSSETDVVISLPDIRLKKTEFVKAELRIYVDEVNVETKSLSFYGNELGKTLNGFYVDLKTCLRRGGNSLHIRIVILCDEEEIYDSKDNLYRECLCFLYERECDIHECEKGSYSIFVTKSHIVEFSGAEVSGIDVGSDWNSYFTRLGNDFLIKLDGQIVAFDTSAVSEAVGIKAITPSFGEKAVFVKNGRKYKIVTQESSVLLISRNPLDLRKYVVIMNAKKVELAGTEPEVAGNGFLYTIPLQMDEERICDYQLINLEKNRIISRDAIKVIHGFDVTFYRDFYLSDADFVDAYVNVSAKHETKRVEFHYGDESILCPMDNGIVEIKIPCIAIRNHAGEKWKLSYTAWIKSIRQEDKIYIDSPDKCTVKLMLGNIAVTEESTGCFAFGNAIFAYSGDRSAGWVDLFLHVSSNHSAQEYRIGRIVLFEQFAEEILFDYHENALYWNRGHGFIGNSAGRFMLRIMTVAGAKNYPLNLDDEIVTRNPELPLDEYEYQIVKESENIFLGEETVLCSGSLCIGDKNEMRFCRNMINILNITYEEGGVLQSVAIRNTFIDQIEYLGIQFVDSENRECPVYRGVLFYMGHSMKHHEFSFEEREQEEVFLYKINPVRVIYINEHTLSITNEEYDGLYYYKYFDKNAMETRYAITDREPTARNRKMYCLADLYTYRKEECQNVKSDKSVREHKR